MFRNSRSQPDLCVAARATAGHPTRAHREKGLGSGRPCVAKPRLHEHAGYAAAVYSDGDAAYG
eukprot:11204519-Lingulodinium_polyedra.AAC.1